MAAARACRPDHVELHVCMARHRASPLSAPGRRPTLCCSVVGAAVATRAEADTLALPTVWVPHSYAACSQHAPNEHLLAPVAKEALRIMTGLFWDLGERAKG